MMKRLRNLNVQAVKPLVSPVEYRRQLPISNQLAATKVVMKGREQIKRILSGQDQRLLIIVGPCSIHDKTVALEYAQRLAQLSSKVQDHLLVVMRVYFEKSRTTIGWKGFINDPDLNNKFDLAKGLFQAREILIQIGELGVLAATEWLDPITPQYLTDLVSWGAIGARTTESQTHRQMASGLSMPIGFKNSTEGSVLAAINGIIAARYPHAFFGIDDNGKASIIYTKGNPWCHLVLRGGNSGPNYDSASIAKAIKELNSAGVSPRLMVDCSHGNSGKNHKIQAEVFNDVLNQRINGNQNIIGLMLESNLYEGRQELTDQAKLAYGISITDACIGWEETKRLLIQASAALTRK